MTMERESQAKEREYDGSEPDSDGVFGEPRAIADDPEPRRARDVDSSAGLPVDPLARLQAEKDELVQTMVRRQADFENYKKRLERDRQEEVRRGTRQLLESLLPALDGFERALRAHGDAGFEEYRKGVELIYRQLDDALTRHGLERIVAAGKPFDPHFHQAIESVESPDHPDGTVLEVFQDGFLFHGRVLRPSIVRVSVAPADTGGDTSSSLPREIR